MATVKCHWLSVIVADEDDNVTKHEDVLSVTFHEGRWALHFADRQLDLPDGHVPVCINGTGTTQRDT